MSKTEGPNGPFLVGDIRARLERVTAGYADRAAFNGPECRALLDQIGSVIDDDLKDALLEVEELELEVESLQERVDELEKKLDEVREVVDA